MPPRARYDPDQVANALVILDANGGNLTRTSQQTGIPVTTLSGWKRGRGVPKEAREKRQVARESLTERLLDLVHQIMDIMPSKLPGATAACLASTMSMAIEKLLLFMGNPTSITQSVSGEDEERVDKLAHFWRMVKDRVEREEAARRVTQEGPSRLPGPTEEARPPEGTSGPPGGQAPQQEEQVQESPPQAPVQLAAYRHLPWP